MDAVRRNPMKVLRSAAFTVEEANEVDAAVALAARGTRSRNQVLRDVILLWARTYGRPVPPSGQEGTDR